MSRATTCAPLDFSNDRHPEDAKRGRRRRFAWKIRRSRSAVGIGELISVMASSLRSFIEVSPNSHFPIQNLPFGIFRINGGGARAGVALGEFVLDLGLLEERGFF